MVNAAKWLRILSVSRKSCATSADSLLHAERIVPMGPGSVLSALSLTAMAASPWEEISLLELRITQMTVLSGMPTLHPGVTSPGKDSRFARSSWGVFVMESHVHIVICFGGWGTKTTAYLRSERCALRTQSSVLHHLTVSPRKRGVALRSWLAGRLRISATLLNVCALVVALNAVWRTRNVLEKQTWVKLYARLLLHSTQVSWQVAFVCSKIYSASTWKTSLNIEYGYSGIDIL